MQGSRRGLRRAAGGAGRPPGRALRGDLRRGRRHDRARRARLRNHAAGAAASRGRRSAASRRAGRLLTIASLPVLTGAWRERGGGCSYIPMATAAAVSSHPLEGRDCSRTRCGRSTWRSSATRSPMPHSIRRSTRSCAGIQSGVDRPGPAARARGAPARRPVHRGARAVHDRHGHPRRRGPPRHHAARAHGRRVLVGPSLPHLERAGGRAGGGGQAEHGDVPAAGRAPGPGPPRLPRERRRHDRLDAPRLARRGGPRGGAARARLDQDRPGPGKHPARRGRVRHRQRSGAPSTGATSRRSRWPTRRWRSAIRWRWSRPRRTSSSTPRSPTRAASTLRSRSRRVRAPRRRPRPRHRRRGPRAGVQRPW